ncbi:hypothetical protein ACNITP_25425 [Escherichia coli]
MSIIILATISTTQVTK